MTDENLEIDSIKEKGKIITFSTKEAIKYNYCNGEVEKPDDTGFLAMAFDVTGIKSTINMQIKPFM